MYNNLWDDLKLLKVSSLVTARLSYKYSTIKSLYSEEGEKWKATYNYIPYLQNRCGHPWETKSLGSWGEWEQRSSESRDSLEEVGL